MKKILGLIVCLFILGVNLMAQVPAGLTEADIRAYLESRGLDEEEVVARLEDRGVDITTIDPSALSGMEAIQLQQTIEEVIAEIEAENEEENDEAIKKAEQDEAIEKAVKAVEAELEGDEEDEEKLKNELRKIPRSIADEVERRIREGDDSEEEGEGDESDEMKEGEGEGEDGIEDEVKDEDLPPAKIYGQQVFRNREIDVFTQAIDIKAPDSYVLGVGDKIVISIWGTSVLETKYEIDEDGSIDPRNMRSIFLKGLTVKRAKQLLLARFAQRYRFSPDQFDVALDFSRTITVNIVGEAISPGSYTIPAINTAVNALVVSGGPSDIGSVRRIEITRVGSSPKLLDMYDFLLNPSVQNDFFLENNDFINIPVTEKVVSIEGAVRRPMYYELLDEEHLVELIKFAGGLTENAYQRNIQVVRYVEDEQRIFDVNYRDLLSKNQNFTLQKGDRIEIGMIERPYENFVSVQGEVLMPGKFELAVGTRLKDVLDRASLRKEARTDLIYLKRLRPDSTLDYQSLSLDRILADSTATDNILLEPQDEISILSKSAYADKGTVVIRGAVRIPTEFPFDISGDLRLSDAIEIAGGLTTQARNIGYLVRKNQSNWEQVSYTSINPLAIMDDRSTPLNLSLMPYDTIEILANPTFSDEYSVQVQGAIRNPGSFKYDQTLTLKDVLTLSGGLKLEAASNQIEVFRLVINENEPTQTIVATVEVDENLDVPFGGDFPLAPFDLVVVRSVPDFELFQTINIQGEVRYPGIYPLLDKNERLFSVLERAGGLSEEAFPPGTTLYRELDSIGYVVLELDEVLQDKNSRYNFILKKGDVIDIPKQEDLVAIQGAIKARELYPEKYLDDADGQVNVAYHEKKRANFYVNRYGAGVSEEGRRALITVEHPNGRIERTHDLLFFKVYPRVEKGSVINVGLKPEKIRKQEERELEREPVNWGKVLSDSISQVGAILSLILLVQRVSN